eukprot:UN11416
MRLFKFMFRNVSYYFVDLFINDIAFLNETARFELLEYNSWRKYQSGFSLKFMDLLKYPYYDKDSCPSLDMRLFQYFRPKT